MSLPNTTLDIGSKITRNIPYFRGLSRLYRSLNVAAIRWGADPVTTAKMKDGTTITVDLRTNTEVDAYYRGEYDSRLLKAIKSLIDPDLYILDVGGNIGFYTVSLGAFLRAQGGSGKVIAFEPFYGNYRRLAENIHRNDLSGFCVVQEFGLSSISAETEITLREDFEHGSGTGNASIPSSEQFDRGFKRARIRIAPLDVAWSDIDCTQRKIGMIKMDIEGHEDHCLVGARATIKAHRPTILMEINKPFYVARGVGLDSTFSPLIPEEYTVFRSAGDRWQRLVSFDECQAIDNVFLVPKEKLELERYAIFR